MWLVINVKYYHKICFFLFSLSVIIKKKKYLHHIIRGAYTNGSYVCYTIVYVSPI